MYVEPTVPVATTADTDVTGEPVVEVAVVKGLAEVIVCPVDDPPGPTDCALAILVGLASKVARPKARKAALSFIVETQSNHLYENIDCQEEEHCRGYFEDEQIDSQHPLPRQHA